MHAETDHEYVEARRVLLDALHALGPHCQAVVLVGAQAIYHHVGEGTLAVAPFTTDGDLVLNPTVLDDEPLLAEAFATAGFALSVKPGTWARDNVQIDLMVPASMGGSGRRGARLGQHGADVARKATGLEAALVDNATYVLPALDPADSRAVDVAIAGLGALLVGKLHKLAERENTPARWSPKDGLDVLRILQGADLKQMGSTLAALEVNLLASAATRDARTHLHRLFGAPNAFGANMAVRASVALEDATFVSAACVALARELRSHWEAARQQ